MNDQQPTAWGETGDGAWSDAVRAGAGNVGLYEPAAQAQPAAGSASVPSGLPSRPSFDGFEGSPVIARVTPEPVPAEVPVAAPVAAGPAFAFPGLNLSTPTPPVAQTPVSTSASPAFESLAEGLSPVVAGSVAPSAVDAELDQLSTMFAAPDRFDAITTPSPTAFDADASAGWPTSTPSFPAASSTPMPSVGSTAFEMPTFPQAVPSVTEVAAAVGMPPFGAPSLGVPSTGLPSAASLPSATPEKTSRFKRSSKPEKADTAKAEKAEKSKTPKAEKVKTPKAEKVKPDKSGSKFGFSKSKKAPQPNVLAPLIEGRPAPVASGVSPAESVTVSEVTSGTATWPSPTSAGLASADGTVSKSDKTSDKKAKGSSALGKVFARTEGGADAAANDERRTKLMRILAALSLAAAAVLLGITLLQKPGTKSTPVPVDPAATAPAQPATVPPEPVVDPAATAPADPVVDPAATAPVDPTATAPVDPVAVDPVATAPVDPTATVPAPIDPAAPAVTAPAATAPAVTAPAATAPAESSDDFFSSGEDFGVQG